MPNILTNFLHRPMNHPMVQGFFIGAALTLFTAQIFGWIMSTRVNGWITLYGCGLPGNGLLKRAACSLIFPGPVNVPQEAMYWLAKVDGAGRGLNGRTDYLLRFPPGGLPPNNAFWSLTMGDAKNKFVPNPIGRYSVSDRSGLVPNADGSIDIHIQNKAPAGHGSNWLPAPTGPFLLWLRVYEPGAAILEGKYRVPPVVPAQGPGADGGLGALILEVMTRHPNTFITMVIVAWALYRRFSQGGSELMPFVQVSLIAWALMTFAFAYFWPSTILNVYKRALLVKGFGDGPVPVNTLYTEPQALFADPLHPPASGSNLMTRGVNRDTLLTAAWLDLRKGPQVLRVPDMAGRYYSVQFTDPSNNTNFAYVGKRATGTGAGDYLISGPDWKGAVPVGMKRIPSPNNNVIVIGRVLVTGDTDLSMAYGLSKQMKLTPLGGSIH